MNTYVEKFAENLKLLIGNKSLLSFSKEIGIPQQTLFRYINCQREISLGNLCKIADFFNEDIDILLGRKNY